MKKSFLLSVSIAVMVANLAHAEFLDLASMPLQTSGSSDVKPNLMFVLDNSGSMGFNYTPDWAADDPDGNAYRSGNSNVVYDAPDWLFSNASFNTQFYNPEVSYSPPLNALGASLESKTSYASFSASAKTFYGTRNRGTSAYYYAYVPGEFCTTPALTSCSNVKSSLYQYPSTIRWCNSPGAASKKVLGTTNGVTDRCQSIRNEVTTVNDSNRYIYLRQPRATYRLEFSATGSAAVNSVKINNIEILSSPTTDASSATTIASRVLANICTSAMTTNCKLAGNVVESVAGAGYAINITTFAGSPINPSNPVQVTFSNTRASVTARVIAASNDIPGSMVYQEIASGQNYTAPGVNKKGVDRIDCKDDTVCTYTEEYTNFANWATYYRTRMLSMKTAASQAFKTLDARYRVGFVTINNPGSNYLKLAPFNQTQKNAWYDKLFATTPSGGTPLRTALSSVGRHFAGKQTLGTDDPVEYACQANFTLLTTDGYWNDNSLPTRINGSTSIGNQDGGSTPAPQFDSSNKSNTLADTAKYFYDTDIRDGALSNCNGALGNSVCGTSNDYPKQNMVTLTLGLGIDGTLLYADDYKTQSMGDFKDLNSTPMLKNWPDPTLAENGTRIDDLWHAAVNAGGTYYSASNPKALKDSLAKGLSEIRAMQGASAAAAASSLAPTKNDNYQYVASYQSVKWIGNLEARTVNTTNLQTSESAVWCVESVAADTCKLPASTYSKDGAFYCKTTNSDQTTCAASSGSLGNDLGFSEPASCYVPVATKCIGTLQTQLGRRKIYFNASNQLTSFDANNIPLTHKLALEAGYNKLSQMQGLQPTDKKLTDPLKVQKLVDYLRGNKTYEDSSLNTDAESRLFRERQATLGDISQSRPAYFKTSNAGYLDSNYKVYKDQTGGRTPVVYVGANDGMLHAFNANSGMEMWAFIPTPVIPNLANLADKEYGANYHTNYVNGSPVVADVCVSGCTGSSATWRTILVSGLSGGGRGYFALDVTNPADPVLLWEYYAKVGDDSASKNLGYTFGNPIVTKLQTGRWVVLFTSGYNNGDYAAKSSSGSFINNSPKGDGGGYLYILDAATGAVVNVLATTEGDKPTGLARISAYAEQMFENNTALNVYGGDLNGNVWRFNINTGTVTKIAQLKDGKGGPQKITTQPELGKVGKSIVVMVGTGKFLEPADLTNTPSNSVYGFKDAGISTSIDRGQLLPQMLGADRKVTISNPPPDFEKGYGWFVDFPAGERVNLDPLLLNGVLLMPTLVPSSEACSGAGYGWFNYFDYKKGGSTLPSGIVSERMSSPAVGYNIVYDGNGVPHVVVTGSNDPTPQQLSMDDQVFGLSANTKSTDIFKQKTNGSYGTKQSWHELIQ